MRLDAFTKCQGTTETIWKSVEYGVEIEVPGDQSGPNVLAVKIVENAWPNIPFAERLAVKLFEKFIKLDSQWLLCVVAVELSEARERDGMLILQFAHPEDLYGAWTAKFLARERLVLASIGRAET